MKRTVSENILAFFKENHSQSFASGALEQMDFRGTNDKKATGSTITRKLRGLAEQGALKVEYGTQHHAFYSLNTEVVKPKMRQIKTDLPDGSARIEYVPV